MTAHRAQKRLGQNFLHDPAVIERIIAAIAPARSDRIVEIGPGQGALTIPLLERVDHLTVIETDRNLIPVIEALADRDRLTVRHADALKVSFDEFGPGTRIVGNLPYNISTPLLFHLQGFRDSIVDEHVMLQKEVVDRMTAGPGSRQYGRLSVMLAPWNDIETCFDIGPGAFRPAPKVWSSFIRIVPRRQARFEIADPDAFQRLVALAFSMRRKSLRRILKGTLSESDITAAGFDPLARPEMLSPEDFARLSELTR